MEAYGSFSRTNRPRPVATAGLPRPLRGIVVPMATPLVDADHLDESGVERLIEHILAGGVQGLFLLGTTGEGPHLRHTLRHEFVIRACRQVAGRVPVLVGITDTISGEALRMAERACDEGAAGVVLAPPYYVPLGQAELADYVRRVVAASPLPVFLYNMPSCTKVAFAPETVAQLLHLENLAGLKDSSGDLAYFSQITRIAASRPEFSVLIGPEGLLPDALSLGAHGGVNGGANVVPHWLTGLYSAALNGDETELERYRAAVAALGQVYRLGSETDWGYLKGLKTALDVLGICRAGMAEPFRPFGSQERAAIREILVSLAPLAPLGPVVPAELS